jgi:hypothetical protein
VTPRAAINKTQAFELKFLDTGPTMPLDQWVTSFITTMKTQSMSESHFVVTWRPAMPWEGSVTMNTWRTTKPLERCLSNKRTHGAIDAIHLPLCAAAVHIRPKQVLGPLAACPRNWLRPCRTLHDRTTSLLGGLKANSNKGHLPSSIKDLHLTAHLLTCRTPVAKISSGPNSWLSHVRKQIALHSFERYVPLTDL